MERSPCLEKSQIKKRGWSEEEDRLLMTYVTKYGHGCWQSVPKAAGLRRSGKSCRLRWINYLRPNVKLGNFTEEEERRIIKLYYAIGSRWSIMARHLPGRTDNSIRNYWNTHLRRRVSTTTRSLFPGGEYDGNNMQEVEEENIPKFIDDEENVLSYLRKFREQLLTINPTEPETVCDTVEAEPEDVLEMSDVDKPVDYFREYIMEQSNSEPSKSSTEFNIQNENDDCIASYTACLPPRPDNLQNEQNRIFQVASYDPPMDVEDALQNVRIALGVEQSNGKRSDSSTNKKRVIKTPSQREYITTKLSFSLEVLKQHFGMTIDDTADSLGISRSSLKRICRENGIERWPSRKRKKTNQSPLNLKAAEEQIIESNNRETTNIMNTIPHITEPLKDSNSNSSVTIKATYGDDIIKFMLPLSSRMEDLEEKVAKRLGLEVGSFRLKYKDDDGDLVLITCDEDLQIVWIAHQDHWTRLQLPCWFFQLPILGLISTIKILCYFCSLIFLYCL